MNWGFIGAGRQANQMIQAFLKLEDACVTKVWDGIYTVAESFAQKWGIPTACKTLDEMLDDESIEAVYLVLPHLVHKEYVLKALEKGKHVLCEKPMAMSAAETEEMVAKAREKGLFLMEAYWTRFFPTMRKLMEIIKSGEMGEIRHVNTEFGIYIPYDPESRFFNKELGGGSIRGAGIYPIGLACTAYGSFPTEMKVVADVKNGVDVRSTALLRFPGGGTATVQTGYDGFNSRDGSITFSNGSIRIPLLITPNELRITKGDKTEILSIPYEEPGLQYEVIEAMKCISEGKTESEIMPLDDSVAFARVFDDFYKELEGGNV